MHRCPVCRTRRKNWGLLQQHMQHEGHRAPCDCGGYHFKHRPGSKFCYVNPLAPLRHVDRQGADDGSIRDVARRLVDQQPDLEGRVTELLQWGVEQVVPTKRVA